MLGISKYICSLFVSLHFQSHSELARIRNYMRTRQSKRTVSTALDLIHSPPLSSTIRDVIFNPLSDPDCF
jgi:hypothetical protein